MQLLTDNPAKYDKVARFARMKYGEKWMDHFEEAKAAIDELEALLAQGQKLMVEINDIRQRMSGINMTPKHMREERWDAWKAELKQKQEEYKSAKQTFAERSRALTTK